MIKNNITNVKHRRKAWPRLAMPSLSSQQWGQGKENTYRTKTDMLFGEEQDGDQQRHQRDRNTKGEEGKNTHRKNTDILHAEKQD